MGTAYVDDGDKCEDDGPHGDDGPNDDDVLRDIRGDGDNNEPKTLRMGNRVSVCLYIFFEPSQHWPAISVSVAML